MNRRTFSPNPRTLRKSYHHQSQQSTERNSPHLIAADIARLQWPCAALSLIQPWCNPLWLTGRKAPTNYLTKSLARGLNKATTLRAFCAELRCSDWMKLKTCVFFVFVFVFSDEARQQTKVNKKKKVIKKTTTTEVPCPPVLKKKQCIRGWEEEYKNIVQQLDSPEEKEKIYEC